MSHSKTDEWCDCGWLSHAINDPVSGLFFDAKSNCIMLGNPNGGQYIVYHCPFCGGRFPVNQPMWVPLIPAGERSRVESLVEGLESAEDILERFGPADHDALIRPEENRNIEYYSLSEWFNIEFYVFDNRLDCRLSIKPRSPIPMK